MGVRGHGLGKQIGNSLSLNHPLWVNSCVWSIGLFISWIYALPSSTLKLRLPAKSKLLNQSLIFCMWTRYMQKIKLWFTLIRSPLISRAVTIKLGAYHWLHLWKSVWFLGWLVFGRAVGETSPATLISQQVVSWSAGRGVRTDWM